MARISCKISEDEYTEHEETLMKQLNIFATGGSVLVVKTLSRLEIKTVFCRNVTGSSHIKNPALLKPLRRSLLNVVNKRDNFCVLDCIATALFSFFFSLASLFVLTTTRKTSRSCVSTRSSWQCFYQLFLLSKNVTFDLCSINVYKLEKTKLVSVYHSKIGPIRFLENNIS